VQRRNPDELQDLITVNLGQKNERGMKAVKPSVSLGADVGGKDAHAATADDCMALRQALTHECRGPYGPAFSEFALVARIDGSVQRWGKRGVENVRLQRKSKYATADIYVPESVWAEGPTPFRAFLATNIAAAIQAIVERAEEGGDSIDSNRLLADVKRATEQFKR
jgi:hypothetical protein